MSENRALPSEHVLVLDPEDLNRAKSVIFALNPHRRIDEVCQVLSHSLVEGLEDW
jgi:hypothetical protein